MSEVGRGELKEFLKKNRCVLLVLLCGLVLLCWPQGKRQTQQDIPQQTGQTESLEQRLEKILSQVSGAGTVRVLLTQAESGETIYQTDDTESTQENGSSLRRETVLVSDGSRQQAGLVRQTQAPVYRGAVVVCQGGDTAPVRLAIVEAVAGVTGLPSNRITVLKMK